MIQEAPRVLVDREAGERYHYVAQVERTAFEKAQSGLLIQYSHNPVSDYDLDLIDYAHHLVSPTNPQHPWRLEPEFDAKSNPDAAREWAEERIRKGMIADPSYYSNWEQPDGPAEHLALAPRVMLDSYGFILGNLKTPDEIKSPQLRQNVMRLLETDVYDIAAATALHDEGRFVTHLFSNGPIGRRLLQRIGVRPEIINLIPGEDTFFQVEEDNERMFEQVTSVHPGMVLVAIGDNFGKRFPRSNRLYQLDDFTPEKMQGWADGYRNRPLSGRPSDLHTRQGLQRHVANEARVFGAFDRWVRSISHTSLGEIATHLNEKWAPKLPQI